MQKNEINLNDVKRKTVKVSEIKIREPFCSLFEKNQPQKRFWDRVKAFFFPKKRNSYNRHTIDMIIQNMRKNGYNENYPIKVIKENSKFTVLDGHYRLIGSKKARIKKVPIEIVNTDNFNGSTAELDKEIVRNLISLQWKRR